MGTYKLLHSRILRMLTLLVLALLLGATDKRVVRKVKGLPSGRYGWVLETYKGMLFLIYITGKRDVEKLLSRPGSPFIFPFPVAIIDVASEQVVEEVVSKHYRAVAIYAEIRGGKHSWLEKNYEHWLIDGNRNVAYACGTTHRGRREPYSQCLRRCIACLVNATAILSRSPCECFIKHDEEVFHWHVIWN